MILVTGASGTIGSELTKALAPMHVRLRVGYHSRPERASGGEPVRLDFQDPGSLKAALDGVDTVFLLSSQVTPEVNLVRAADEAGVRRIVKLSVWGADGEGFSFARWHRAVEREIEASGLLWTFLRPNGFMQNVVNFMGATIKSQGAFYLPAGDARVSHVDARDIAAVAAAVLTRPGHDKRAYKLSGPQALGYGEIAETLSSVLGRTISYVNISDEDYKKGAMAAGIPEGYADALVDLNRFYRGAGSDEVTQDVELVTGKAPIPFEQFARDHAAALR